MAPKKSASKPTATATTSTASSSALAPFDAIPAGAIPTTPTPSSPNQHSFLPPSPGIPESTDETAARIMKHMNADHADSLGRYLAHFGKVWAISSRSPTMIKLQKESMTIASTGPVGTESSRGLHTTIRFEPDLKADLKDARERLIDMDREATTALGREAVTVRRYAPPHQTWELGWWVFVAGAWLVFTRRANMFEGSWFWTAALQWAPTPFIVWLRVWQPRILLVMLGLHALETAEMAFSKMKKLNVELWSETWWAWVLSVAFEGFPVWGRLDGVVEEERERRKKTMH